MIIGAMIAVSHEAGEIENGPLVLALRERARLLGAAFRSVVFAQVRISALNTALTGLYLLGPVSLLGVQLPLTKTLIAVTFIAGLLPVIGNLISNTAIVVVESQCVPCAGDQLSSLSDHHSQAGVFRECPCDGSPYPKRGRGSFW